MKKSKKGFTVIELLATLVLFGVILTISLLSFSSVQKAVLKRQRENVISNIKIAAKEYVSKTNVNKVYVETLIQEGYLEADNESNNIYAPDNNESLNCYYVDFTEEQEKLIQGEYNDISGTCNYDLISDALLSIKYCAVPVSSSCNEGDYQSFSNEWIDAKNKNVYLKVFNTSDILTGASYTWISPLAPDLHYEGNVHTIDIPSRGYINEVYQVIASKNGKTYSAAKRVKIDLKNPIIQDLEVINQDSVMDRNVKVTLLDNESGLSKYVFTTESLETNIDDHAWISIEGNKKDIIINTDSAFSGTYYIWVKDKAGNINSSSVELKLLDITPPSCNYIGENNSWTSSDVTLTWGCIDEATEGAISGCQQNIYGTKTIDYSLDTYTVEEYKIIDNAGYETLCEEKEISVKVDKTKPETTSVVVKSDTTSYNSKNITVTVSGKDDHSGVSAYCAVTSNDSSKCTWSEEDDIKITLDTKDGSGDSFTIYGFVKDAIGNISENIKTKSYTLYTECTQTSVKNYSDWSKCSKECDGGVQERTVSYEDTYLETACPDQIESQECNTEACCDEGEYEYTSCSDDGYKEYSRYNECIEDYESYTSLESCESADYKCEWGTCDGEYKYKTCYYYEGGVSKSYQAKKEACENLDTINEYRWDTNCNKYYITTCQKETVTNGICNYDYKNDKDETGTIIRDNLRDKTYYDENCVEEPENFCDIDDELLFGKGKGTISGNYGTWYSSVSKYWCYSGSGCYRTNGYDRVCATDACGKYKGMTAYQIKQETGCKFGRYWCSCSKEGKF